MAYRRACASGLEDPSRVTLGTVFMRCTIRLLLSGFLTAFIGWSQPYIISTIAGTERVLDGNPAINVPLRDPRAVKVDGSGNFYIADTRDHRIRKLNQAGTLSTIACNGLPRFGA